MDVLRENARQEYRQVVDDARHHYVSPYEEWTSDELRELLVEYRIPIRDSAHATHETLVRICDKVFGTEELEDADAEQMAESQRSCIRRYSVEDLVRMEACARRIQKAFFRRQALKRQREMQQHSRRIEQEQTRINYCEEGMEHSDCTHEEGYHYDEVSRRRSMLRRINQQGDDYDEEVEVEWRKPSWKFAKRFEAANRPHRSGKRMDQYDWTKVTSGRHCYAGGCGEQLDLWNEGRTSEFSQFGSGITNYFKVRPRCVQIALFATVVLINLLFSF